MKLTIRCDRSHPERFRLEEVHALCAGDLYNPLVVEGAEGADPLTLYLLLLPSAGSPESSALARAEGFGRERGHAGCMRSVLSLRTAELRDMWDSATESSESSDEAPSALDVVRSAHLLVRDSAGLTLASGPVPLVLRPLSDWDYSVADPPRDGFTPTVSVDEVSGGVRVTVANRYGQESAVVRDGVDGGTPSIAVSKDRRTGVVAVSAYGPDGALTSWETIGPFPDLGPVERRLGTLEGADAGKSARGIAAEEVAAIVGAAPEAFDTLKEIADFLSDDRAAGTVARRLSDLESGKVDKETGKGLSSNDYTTAEKTKLAAAATSADVAAVSSSKRGKLDLVVYQDAVGWTMVDGSGGVYGVFAPLDGVDAQWALAEDGVEGASWGLQYRADPGDWRLAKGGAAGAFTFVAPADAGSLEFTVSDATYTLTRISPLPTTDTLAKTSEVPAVDGKRDLADLLVRAAPTPANGGVFYVDGVGPLEYDSMVSRWHRYFSDGWEILWVDGVGYKLRLTQYEGDDGEEEKGFTLTAAGNYSADVTVGGATYRVVGAADALAKVSQLPSVPSASTSAPLMDGAASAGSSGAWADGAHRHPHDTSKLDVYPFDTTAAPDGDGVLTVMPFTSAQYTAQSGDNFVVDVGALPQGVAAGTKVRDCILAIDATANTPSVTFSRDSAGAATFVPANGNDSNMACKAGAVNVYYISEYAPNAFLVARQVIGGDS